MSNHDIRELDEDTVARIVADKGSNGQRERSRDVVDLTVHE